MFFKISVFKNYAIFTGKQMRSSLFLIKLQACSFMNISSSNVTFKIETITKSIIGLTNLCYKFIQKQPFTMFFKINVLKNFAIFTGKKTTLESLFYKLAGLQAWNFFKKRLQHNCFSVKIAKFLRIALFQWLLLFFLLQNLLEENQFALHLLTLYLISIL